MVDDCLAIYNKPGGGAGCCLHVLLDDCNTENGFAEFCAEWAIGQGHADCWAVAVKLASMTRTQRTKLARMCHKGARNPYKEGTMPRKIRSNHRKTAAIVQLAAERDAVKDKAREAYRKGLVDGIELASRATDNDPVAVTQTIGKLRLLPGGITYPSRWERFVSWLWRRG